MKRVILVACVAFIALVSGGNAGRAASAPGGGPLPSGVHMDNGFYMYDAVSMPTNPHTFILQGDRLSDGACGFGERVRLHPGDAPIADQEIGYNAATCQMIIARGQPNGDSPLQAGGTTTSAGLVQARAAAEASLVTNGALSSGNSTAHTYSRYTDPPGITVTSLTDRVNWSWNGSCVTSGYWTRTDYWLSDTGWVRDSIQDFWDPSCSFDQTDTQAKYHNGAFCLGQPATHTDYWYNRIAGFPDGSILGSWYSTKSGGCESWLTAHHEYAYGN